MVPAWPQHLAGHRTSGNKRSEDGLGLAPIRWRMLPTSGLQLAEPSLKALSACRFSGEFDLRQERQPGPVQCITSERNFKRPNTLPAVHARNDPEWLFCSIAGLRCTQLEAYVTMLPQSVERVMLDLSTLASPRAELGGKSLINCFCRRIKGGPSALCGDVRPWSVPAPPEGVLYCPALLGGPFEQDRRHRLTSTSAVHAASSSSCQTCMVLDIAEAFHAELRPNSL